MGWTLYKRVFPVFLELQDYLLEDIDRIEGIMVRAAHFGDANAVNSVINIHDQERRDTQGRGGGSFMWKRRRTELRSFPRVRYGGTLASNVYYGLGKYFAVGNEVFPNGRDASDHGR